MSKEESKEIRELRESLDKAYTELADGVREFLELRASFHKLRKEKQDLSEAAIKAITSSSNTSEEMAKKMLDEWFKTVSTGSSNKEDDNV